MQKLAKTKEEKILSRLAREFSYSSDGFLDSWKIHSRRGADGRIRGDCEDFALTLAWRLAGESWFRLLWHLLSLKSVIWHVTSVQKDGSRGGGHVALWHRGSGWADNIYPAWKGSTPHTRRFPWLLPLLLLKLGSGKIFRMF